MPLAETCSATRALKMVESWLVDLESSESALNDSDKKSLENALDQIKEESGTSSKTLLRVELLRLPRKGPAKRTVGRLPRMLHKSWIPRRSWRSYEMRIQQSKMAGK